MRKHSISLHRDAGHLHEQRRWSWECRQAKVTRVQREQKKLLILQTEVSIHKQAFGDTENLKKIISFKTKNENAPPQKKIKKGRNAMNDQMKEANFLKTYFQAIYPTYFQMVQDKTRNINVERVKN